MTSDPSLQPLILGGTGKLGRALARLWPVAAPAPLWQSRTPGAGFLHWDILNDPAPDLPPLSGIIVLAGVTHGDAQALAANTTLAQAGADLGVRYGLPALVASSQAVYGRQTGALSERDIPVPATPYGAAKLAMEQAVAAPHVTCLRIGNVVGCDALADAMTRPPVVLDRFADGQGARRAMLGAADLARVLLGLLALPQRPPVLNVARPGVLAMADLLQAADVAFTWRPAPPAALPELALDVTLLQNICPLPPADAPALARQGWDR